MDSLLSLIAPAPAARAPTLPATTVSVGSAMVEENPRANPKRIIHNAFPLITNSLAIFLADGEEGAIQSQNKYEQAENDQYNAQQNLVQV